MSGEEKWKMPRFLLACVLSSSVGSDSFATLWTIACQAPLSMELFRQEYSSGLPLPLPKPGIEPMSPVSPALASRFLTTASPGKPYSCWHQWTNKPTWTAVSELTCRKKNKFVLRTLFFVSCSQQHSQDTTAIISNIFLIHIWNVDFQILKNNNWGNPLVVQWLGFSALITGHALGPVQS